MKLLLTGLNHRTAPVEVRERLAFEEKALPEALDQLRHCPGLVEGMILSTCNRVEIAVTADEEADANSAVESFLAESRSVARDWVSPHLYRFDGPDAVKHLFRVASSLDSMIVGEPQILGQLKSAYQLAKDCGTLSGDLDLVITKAFNVAKRVRSETEIGGSAVSVSSAAVKLAREIFGSLKDSRVLVIGAGEMAENAIDHLRAAGVAEILLTNRTRERAEALALEVGGRVVDYECFQESLPEVDIVIASSGAQHHILTWDEMRTAIRRRRNRPMFLIDIAVPRNIQPNVKELDNVFLYDIDDLGEQVDNNLKGRIERAHQAELIIDEEVDTLMRRLKTRHTGPIIQGWQEQLEQWRLSEIERRRTKLGTLTPQQEEAVEAITRGITNKFLHRIIAEMRQAEVRKKDEGGE
jgi:glutamyl-tRNA reductase